ncbi:DegT/DnrJ/EryC1/StrS family aminotransferase [Daejeonella lutea]|uniref:dTDP-4-amino-4,6-dideoxygalactose transaminase n=1 Tax=Daejeonella lutea TaxID=572036 RepID=A0A1T5FCD9_9SPHI|nr:DegT/DnrJ/EryC1/StrS family aminotransferase [Daejeonella lutea]SKB93748.1 dTDP-4-amino-4,6-dideoxygalactose transaminase [Daejeonella lutea]
MIPIAKPYMTADEASAAHDTILTGWITQGPKTAEFEQLFAEYTGARYAVAVSNCTTGLHLSMLVAGVGPGDEVICPSMSYIATSNSIKYVGGVPVFAEINPFNYNLDLTDTEKKITPKTKAILLVHQIGIPADIEAFQELASKYNLILIEDAACAIGSSYQGAKIGSHSDLVCFSFHPRKVISTGDGGMITTNNPAYCERLKLLRQHGMSVNDRIRHESKSLIFEDHVEVGYNYRMTDIQAAVGIEQLKKLDWIVEERRKIAHQYIEAFKDIPCIRMMSESEGDFLNYQSFSIYLNSQCAISRNEIMAQMLEAGIATRRGVMTVHREIAYKHECVGLELPISEDASDRSIIIPLYVPMEQKDIDYVINTFTAILSSAVVSN